MLYFLKGYNLITMKKYFLLFALLFFQFSFSQENKLSLAALELTKEKVVYDPSYFSISYPNGDIPKGKGVCTDFIIRAYRKLGVDLQKEVHEDMKTNFSKCPKLWGQKSTDKNIDHRRVPNLMTYFKRQQAEKIISRNPKDY